jgi:PAS domain S-box-containing protein
MCNDRFVEMSGFTRDELLAADNLNDLTDIREDMEGVAGDRFESGPDRSFRRGISSWLRPDGAENYYEWTACPVTIDGKEHLVGIDRDITERVIADRKLKEHQNRLEMIMQFASDGINICRRDPETGKCQLVMCNDKYVEMSGYTRKELMSTDSLDDLLIWVDGPKDPMEILRSPKPCRGLDSWKRPDGKENYHEYTAVPIEVGESVHTIGIDRDVTDRIRRERELRSVNERLNNIIEFLPDPTFVVDRDKRAIAWNRAIEEITGVKKDQIIGNDSDAVRSALRVGDRPMLVDLIAAEDPKLIEDAKDTYKHFEQKGDYLLAEIDLEDPGTGREVHHWLAASVVRDDQGNVFGAIESIRDITALRETTQKLEAARQSERLFRGRLEGLHEVNIELAQADSPLEMCRLAIELGRARLGFDRLGIWLAVPGEPETFDGTFGADEQGNLRDETNCHIAFTGDKLLQKVMARRSPSAVLERGHIADHQRQVVGEGMRALAPLWDGREVIGFLATDNLLGKQPITEQDREVLGLLATNIAHLYTRKRTEQSLQASEETERSFRRQLQGLHEVNTALAEADSPRELCRLAVELGRSKLGFDRLGVWFISEESPDVLTGSFGIDEHGNLRDEWGNRHGLPESRDGTGGLSDRQTAYYVEDTPLRNHLCEQVGVGTVARAAMWDGQRIIGRISTDNLLRKDPITQQRIELLKLFAADVGHLYTRKRTEELLRKSEEDYRLLVENQSEVLVKLDSEYRIAFASPSFYQMFERTEAELLGGELDPMIHAEDMAKVTEARRSLESPAHSCRFECRMMVKDGFRWLGWSANAVTDAEGKVTSVVAVGRDITERKRAEEELRQAQKMEAIGRLAGGIAHDFNNQLTVIKGYGDLLLRELEKDDPVHEQIEEIHKAATQAEALTNQLLAFSHKQILRPQIIDLNDVLSDIANALDRMLGENVELCIIPGEGLGNTEADPVQVRQAIMNVVINAWDAMPKGGQIKITTDNVTVSDEYVSRFPEAQVGDHVLLSISDTGTGMDDETIQRVFEPFFTTKPIGEGTGLGLPMVYGFVKQSGGHISLSSRAGVGTMLRMYLPRTDRKAVPCSPPPQRPDSKETKPSSSPKMTSPSSS